MTDTIAHPVTPLDPAVERKAPSEDTDVQEIVRCILAVQARNARLDGRPLGRGTHTKGVCVRAELEVLDVAATAASPALARRLARGLFAHPGVYPATVRFANAESRIFPDTRRDVRALSFMVEVPAGVLGPASMRLDYSLNSAPTFPINDPHAFATFVRLRSAERKWTVLRSLSLRDLAGLVRTAYLAIRQQRRSGVRPYQQMRYWSTVPFGHGPDEVAKFSAIPDADNPAHALTRSPNCLREELLRHLNADARMSRFDFAVQLLDLDRMRYRRSRRDAAFWVENGTVEWPEPEAPFHVVGRLTLVPKSALPPDACEASYIDVTQHALPECRPLGGLNRARWAAELASRNARLGVGQGAAALAPAATHAAPPPHRSLMGRIARYGVAAAAVLFVLVLWGAIRYTRAVAANIPALEPVDEVRYLDQGWGTSIDAPARELYYYTAQGAAFQGIALRYSWFVHLEMPFGRERLTTPDHMRRLGFIVEPQPTRANPDHLPIGFARLWNEDIGDYLIDITCSACHTGQLNVTRNARTTAIRIDGGSALHAFQDGSLLTTAPGHFGPTLVASLGTTYWNPIKFNRFARRVLGDRYPEGRSQLADDLWEVVDGLQRLAFAEWWHGLYPVQGGFGRLDALTGITNAVFGDHISPSNYKVGNAPVNFPPVWNIWKFDWVQYNASVSQPMARNVGETLGTGALYRLLDRYGRPLPPEERFRTSAAFDNLARIEAALQVLRPPQWPEDLLGRIDRVRAERGRELFETYCVGCHGPKRAAEPLKRALAPMMAADDPVWIIRWKALDDVGTDPAAAENFVNNRVDLTPLGLDAAEVRGRLMRELDEARRRRATLVPDLQRELARLKSAQADEGTLSEVQTQIDEAAAYDRAHAAAARTFESLDLSRVPEGLGLTIIGMHIRDRYYAEHRFSEELRACYDGFGWLDLPQAVPGYKPRPLEGIWAAPPYLHNGSVPTLYDLLSPADKRPAGFHTGRREFDPVHVGYVTELPPGSGGFWLDTSIPGNRNVGHEFRQGWMPYDEQNPVPAKGILGPELSHEQRLDLIEYLKVHRDETGAPTQMPHDCVALRYGRVDEAPQ